MHTRSAKRSTARDLVRVLFRHKRQMLWFFATTMGLVILGLVVMPAHLHVSKPACSCAWVRKASASIPRRWSGRPCKSNRRENEINSELDILRSRVLLQDVVEKLGSDAILRSTADGKRTWTQTLMLPLNTVVSLVTQSAEGTPEERAVRSSKA